MILWRAGSARLAWWLCKVIRSYIKLLQPTRHREEMKEKGETLSFSMHQPKGVAGFTKKKEKGGKSMEM